tara:strand:- start:599 stop:877 length:279 start_codon:yes stop_codon:yes gene_type:complete
MNMDLKKFEKELNKAGYFISTDQVVTTRGDVVGQMDPYGTFLCDVDEVCVILSATPVKIKKPAKVLKRARTEDGHFKADDKSTPDVNEAWEV